MFRLFYDFVPMQAIFVFSEQSVFIYHHHRLLHNPGRRLFLLLLLLVFSSPFCWPKQKRNSSRKIFHKWNVIFLVFFFVRLSIQHRRLYHGSLCFFFSLMSLWIHNGLQAWLPQQCQYTHEAAIPLAFFSFTLFLCSVFLVMADAISTHANDFFILRPFVFCCCWKIMN